MKFISATAVAALALGSVDGVTSKNIEGRGLFAKLREHRQDPDADTDVANADDSSDVTAATPAAVTAPAAASTAAAAAASQQGADSIPAAPDVGPDGFPALPAVSAMADATSQTMKSLNSQASILEARIAQMQMENEAKLARQKAVFETKLKAQEMSNRDVVHQNQLISTQISVLQEQNGNLTKEAEQLEDENRLGRAELATIEAKLKTATKFIDESMKATNDKGSKFLEVLQVSTSSKSRKANGIVHGASQEQDEEIEDASQDQADDEDQEEEVVEEDGDDQDQDAPASFFQTKRLIDAEDDDTNEAPVSLLGVSSKVRRAKATTKEESGEQLQLGAMSEIEQELMKPEAKQAKEAQIAASPKDLLKVLSSQVDGLTQEQQANGDKLKSMFLSAYKAGTKRHTALLKKQHELNVTKTELTAKQTKLHSAVSHLDTTHEHLYGRLRGLGLFMQRLGHLAIAPASEAKHLLTSLPAKIMPSKPKEH